MTTHRPAVTPQPLTLDGAGVRLRGYDYGNERARPLVLVHGIEDFALALEPLADAFRGNYHVVVVRPARARRQRQAGRLHHGALHRRPARGDLAAPARAADPGRSQPRRADREPVRGGVSRDAARGRQHRRHGSADAHSRARLARRSSSAPARRSRGCCARRPRPSDDGPRRRHQPLSALPPAARSGARAQAGRARHRAASARRAPVQVGPARSTRCACRRRRRSRRSASGGRSARCSWSRRARSTSSCGAAAGSTPRPCARTPRRSGGAWRSSATPSHVEIPGAGHHVHFDAPAELVQVLQEFLRGFGRARGGQGRSPPPA